MANVSCERLDSLKSDSSGETFVKKNPTLTRRVKINLDQFVTVFSTTRSINICSTTRD